MINADLALISHQREETGRQAAARLDCKKRKNMKISIPMKGQRDWRKELPQVFENKRFSPWKTSIDLCGVETWAKTSTFHSGSTMVVVGNDGKTLENFHYQGTSVAHLHKEQCPIKKEENQESVKTL